MAIKMGGKRGQILNRIWPNGIPIQELRAIIDTMNPGAPGQVLGEFYENEYGPYISEGKLFLSTEPKPIGGKAGMDGRHIWKCNKGNNTRGWELWHELVRLKPLAGPSRRLPKGIGEVADAGRQEAAPLQESLSTRLEYGEKRIEALQAALQEIRLTGFEQAEKQVETLRSASEQSLQAVRRNVVTFGVIIVAVQVVIAIGVFLGP